MRVLVTSGGHPNEMQASEIWKELKKDNVSINVSYEFIPFQETMHASLNKFLKALLKPNELESRFVSIPEDERKISEEIIRVIRQDLKQPKEKNAKIVEDLYEKLDELFPDTRFWELLPELNNSCNESLYENYINLLLNKMGSDVIVDIHNSRVLSRGIKPFLYELPKRYEGLNKRLIKLGYTRSKRFFRVDENCYSVEVPADFVKTRFSRYALMRLVPVEYHAQFHDPKLPSNLKNFDSQKNIVRDIIEEVASF